MSRSPAYDTFQNPDCWFKLNVKEYVFSFISCQPKPEKMRDQGRARLPHPDSCILQRLSRRPAACFKYISFYLSWSYRRFECLRFCKTMKRANHRICLENECTRWPRIPPRPTDPTASTLPCRSRNLHLLISDLKSLFAYRFYFPVRCIHCRRPLRRLR